MRTYHKSYWRGKKQKSSVVVRRFKYNGCIIEILNKKTYSFKYEWVIIPVSAVTKKACAKHKLDRAYDPTSHKLLEFAIYNAKVAVNEMRTPYWCAAWK